MADVLPLFPDQPPPERTSLRRGDLVNVYLDTDHRTRREGLALLVLFLRRPAGWPELQTWRVELTHVANDRGELLQVPEGAARDCVRTVHPSDRLSS